VKRAFVELPAFSAWVRSGKIADEQLRQLQADLMGGAGDTISGTGGLKKARWGRPHGGKSGGWRVIFADYPAYRLTVLMAAFPKNVKANLSAAEARELKRLKGLLDKEIEARYGTGQ